MSDPLPIYTTYWLDRIGLCRRCRNPLFAWFTWSPLPAPGERLYVCPACGARTCLYSAAWL